MRKKEQHEERPTVLDAPSERTVLDAISDRLKKTENYDERLHLHEARKRMLNFGTVRRLIILNSGRLLIRWNGERAM